MRPQSQTKTNTRISNRQPMVYNTADISPRVLTPVSVLSPLRTTHVPLCVPGGRLVTSGRYRGRKKENGRAEALQPRPVLLSDSPPSIGNGCAVRIWGASGSGLHRECGGLDGKACGPRRGLLPFGRMAGEGPCPVRVIPWLARSCLAAVTVGAAVIRLRKRQRRPAGRRGHAQVSSSPSHDLSPRTRAR